MSELAVGSIAGLASNGFVVDVASGSQLTQPGMILQVVSSTKTDTFSSTSTSYVVPTGLTLSITPSSTSSKILVLFSVSVAYEIDSNSGVGVAPFRDATNLVVPDSPGSRTPSVVHENSYNYRNQGVSMLPVSGQFLDSPNTTSSVTYDIRVASVNAGTFYVNRSVSDTDDARRPRGVSSITVMEVAG